MFQRRSTEDSLQPGKSRIKNPLNHRPEVNNRERPYPEECSQRQLVLACNCPAKPAHTTKPSPVCALRELAAPSAPIERQDYAQADDASQHASEQNGPERATQSCKRPDHGHHFHVAQAHAFLLAQSFVRSREAPEQKAPERGSENGIDEAGCVPLQSLVQQLNAQKLRKPSARRHKCGEQQSHSKSRPGHEIRK